jgi:hypothetical protein
MNADAAIGVQPTSGESVGTRKLNTWNYLGA